MPSIDRTENSLVMVITELDEGGAEKAFVRIACGLQAKAWHVHAVSLRNAGPLAAQLETHNIPVTALNTATLTAPFAIPKLSRLLKTLRPDAVFSFLHQANLLSRIAASLAHIPCHISGIRVADRRPFVVLPDRFTRKLTTHYVACSETVARRHAALCRIPPSRISVIHNGVDIDQLLLAPPVPRSVLGLNENDFVVLMAGRLTSQKAPQLLLHAFRILQQQPSPRRPRLLLAGEGPDRPKLEQLASQLPDPSAVNFIGWRHDLPGIMKSADLFVLPSAWEGLPNVLLEAQAIGLPVAATSVDGCIDALQSGAAGRLFPANDPNAIAQLIAEQIQNPRPAHEMATLAQHQLQQTGHWEHCINRCHLLLQRLVKNKTAELM